jgi:uncharacterized protein (TIGR03435 family)
VRPQALRARRRLAASALAVAASTYVAPYARGAAQVSTGSQQPTQLRFDVASIKERDPNVPLGLVGMNVLPGRLTNRCATLNSLLFYAYRLTFSSPVQGLPDWASTPCSSFSTANTYEFQATMPPDTTDAQARQMMQTFLADRFKLSVHRETKIMPVYALVIGSGGFKLKPTDPKNDPPRERGSIRCPPEDRGCRNLVMGSVPVSEFASALGVTAGRPVIDKTGLTGTYYLDLTWAGDTAPSSPLPSLPTALKERFGLELRPESGPVDILVIDHVEKPTPN